MSTRFAKGLNAIYYKVEKVASSTIISSTMISERNAFSFGHNGTFYNHFETVMHLFTPQCCEKSKPKKF